MAFYRRRRRSRGRRRQPSMIAKLFSPIASLVSKMGVKQPAPKWLLTGIASMFLVRTFYEDGWDTIMDYFDDGSDWLQDKVGM